MVYRRNCFSEKNRDKITMLLNLCCAVNATAIIFQCYISRYPYFDMVVVADPIFEAYALNFGNNSWHKNPTRLITKPLVQRCGLLLLKVVDEKAIKRSEWLIRRM